MNYSCKKCPYCASDGWCKYHSIKVDKEKLMCSEGFSIRSYKGMAKASDYYNKNKDDPKVGKIWDKLEAMRSFYLKVYMDGTLEERDCHVRERAKKETDRVS